MTTLQNILVNNSLKNSRVLSGKNNLNVDITSVTVAEVPDAANWLQGGELVCTTAYFVSTEVKHQLDWVKSLYKNGAGALAIKPNRFLGGVPDILINTSNDLGFPIIELPAQITWPEVIESVMKPLFSNQVEILQKTENIHNKFTKLILTNASIDKITSEVSSLTKNLVIVENEEHTNLSTTIENSNSPIFISKLLKIRKTDDSVKENLSSIDYKNKLQNTETNFLEYDVKIDNKNIKNITYPIISNDEVYGFITLLDVTDSYTQIDDISLINGANAIALQLVNERLKIETSKRHTLTLINDLISNNISSTHSRIKNSLNIETSTRISVILIGIEYAINYLSEYYVKQNENKIIHFIKSNLSKQKIKSIVGIEDALCKIIIFKDEHKKNNSIENLEDILSVSLKQCTEEELIVNYKCAIGSYHEGVSSANESYTEANDVFTILERINNNNFDNPKILSYQNLGVYRLILMINNNDSLRNFCLELLNPLISYDKKNNSNLLFTLKAYFDNNCEIKATSLSMYLHYNTVRYRIKKIEELLDYDIHDLKYQALFYVAIESYPLF